jgi:hypothetical protein
MKYETPRLTALAPAINAIQGVPKPLVGIFDGKTEEYNEAMGAYADWE